MVNLKAKNPLDSDDGNDGGHIISASQEVIEELVVCVLIIAAYLKHLTV